MVRPKKAFFYVFFLVFSLAILIQLFFFVHLISFVFDLFAIKSEWQLLLLLFLLLGRILFQKGSSCTRYTNNKHTFIYAWHGMNALYAVYYRRVNEILLPSMVRSLTFFLFICIYLSFANAICLNIILSLSLSLSLCLWLFFPSLFILFAHFIPFPAHFIKIKSPIAYLFSFINNWCVIYIHAQLWQAQRQSHTHSSISRNNNNNDDDDDDDNNSNDNEKHANESFIFILSAIISRTYMTVLKAAIFNMVYDKTRFI